MQYNNQQDPPPPGWGYPPSAPPPYVPDNQYTQPNYGNQEQDVENGFAATGFNNKNVRRAFIRKVYLILTAQLFITLAIISIFQFVQPVKQFVKTHTYIYYLAYAVFLVTYIALACCTGFRRKFPGNFIALFIFTLAFSYMAGMLAAFYTGESVFICVGITALICLGITLFACQTKIDFTMCTGMFFVLSLVLFFFGIAVSIVFATGNGSRWLYCVYGAVAALIFSLFLVYDTQMVIGGGKYEISEEDYVYGAMQIYVDVVYLFIILLGLFGNRD